MDLKFIFLFVFLALSAVFSLGAATDFGDPEAYTEAARTGERDARCGGGKKGGKGGKKGKWFG